MLRSLLSTVALLWVAVIFAQAPAGYYDGTDGLTGDQLKAALNSIIKGHTTYPYSSTATDVWDILKETDKDPNNPNNVVGIYSGFSMDAAGEYNNGDGWNREHVWAKSRGDFGTTEGAGTDLHHLRAADVSTNSARSNRTFSDAADVQYIDASGTHSGPTQSYTSSTEFIWKPRAEVRGDVARMIFYMATRYEGEAGEPDLELTDLVLSNTDKSPLHGRLTDLLTWHQQDPVDDMERNRNDIIYSYQNNRNPFIDHPEFVGLIWGGSQSTAPYFTSTGTTLGQVGVAYNYSVTTGGGNGALSVTAVVLPSWLSLADNGNGIATLSGTPSVAGTFNVQLQVSDGTASDTQSFDITVTSNGGGSGSASELLFSEYIEGSSYNKAVEVANFTGSAVDLSAYVIKKQTNGAGSWSAGLALTGSLANGEVFVVAHSSADAAITSQADFTGGNNELTFNGNDALGLFKNDVLVDAIGVFNSTANFGQDVTLVRNATISEPNTSYTTNEWTSYPSNTFNYLGSHSMNGGTPPNQAPATAITSPSYGSTYTTGDEVSVTASASDADGAIVSVEFFVNGASIGTATSTPYSVVFTVAEGVSALTAVATDDDGESTTSSEVTISASTPNQAPTVGITSPSNGSTYTSGDNVNVSATASDVDGAIASVEFFVNGSSVAVATSSPFTASFTIGVGSYNVTAIATDNDGASTVSATVNITGEEVVTPGNQVLLYDDFESGWGNYMDGGSDAYYYNGGSYAFEGSAAAGIQDNSGVNSSITSIPFDASGFDQVSVEFYFYSRSMEYGEDFWFRYYDGTSWQTVASWASGIDYEDYNFYVTTVVLDASQYTLSSLAQIRFQCDASANADDIYLDEITVTGINLGGARVDNKLVATTFMRAGTREDQLGEADLSIYPNPIKADFSVEFSSSEIEMVRVEVLDIKGTVMHTKQVKTAVGLNRIQMDVSGLMDGIYLLQMYQGGEVLTRQIMKVD